MRNVMLAVMAGGLAVGTLDLLFAWGFWAPHGVTLTAILQSIAAGWYGKASHAMGTASAVVGGFSHYAIATCFVLAYLLLARLRPALLRRPLASGFAYGLALYAVMNFVVLPLSAAGMPKFDNVAWVGSSILVHGILGAICAWFAGRAASRDLAAA